MDFQDAALLLCVIDACNKTQRTVHESLTKCQESCAAVFLDVSYSITVCFVFSTVEEPREALGPVVSSVSHHNEPHGNCWMVGCVCVCVRNQETLLLIYKKRLILIVTQNNIIILLKCLLTLHVEICWLLETFVVQYPILRLK